jgi:hypothetical protein
MFFRAGWGSVGVGVAMWVTGREARGSRSSKRESRESRGTSYEAAAGRGRASDALMMRS